MAPNMNEGLSLETGWAFQWFETPMFTNGRNNDFATPKTRQAKLVCRARTGRR
jgi:hypothetical protein